MGPVRHPNHHKEQFRFSLSRAIRGLIILIVLFVLSLFIATAKTIKKLSIVDEPVQKKAAAVPVTKVKTALVKYGDDARVKDATEGCISKIWDIPNVLNRHMVPPPSGPIVLTCCQTTKGPLSIAVHPSWAPLGAERFLHMVRTGYFSSKIALFRCVKKFICQFGLAGRTELNRSFYSIADDPSWLPKGPDHRSNEQGVKRFQKGYLAYAGSGENSRSNQLIVALNDNERLAGGSPWEVPWGEVVGIDSFNTLDKIYTGYGENGVSQGRLRREGSSEAIASDFPEMDYIVSCVIVEDERL